MEQKRLTDEQKGVAKMIINGNCLDELDKLDENSIDAIITDPPYELNFMDKGWDNAGISFNSETWEKCQRVLKPGGYLLAFGGSRTFHRIACAIEDAGFEIRDTIMWLYGSGFPKSMNVGLAIDKKNGVESKVVGTGKSGASNTHTRCMNSETKDGKSVFGGEYEIKQAQNKWQGWGTALKPSFEPIIVARKPFKGSLVDNVIKNGVGGINIDECRVGNETHKVNINDFSNKPGNKFGNGEPIAKLGEKEITGRFPANTILTYDETDFDEVCGGFPNTNGGSYKKVARKRRGFMLSGSENNIQEANSPDNYGDSGSASRYFYCAKASKKDRDEGLDTFNQEKVNDGRQTPIDNAFQRGETLRKNTHPTVKPTTLMQYLVRLVAPKGATILDPFMGSGSTGKAIAYENVERNANYKFIGIELDPQYCKIAEARIKGVKG